VLIWGASGGIGAYAVQYVLNGGGTPVGVVSSPERAALLHELGRRDEALAECENAVRLLELEAGVSPSRQLLDERVRLERSRDVTFLGTHRHDGQSSQAEVLVEPEPAVRESRGRDLVPAWLTELEDDLPLTTLEEHVEEQRRAEPRGALGVWFSVKLQT